MTYTKIIGRTLGVLPISLLFILPAFAHAGVFSALVSLFTEETKEHTTALLETSAQTVSLLRAAVHTDPNPSKGGGDILIDGDALVPEGGFAEAEHKNGGEISVYIVREGDALSQIAEMYGVTTNTILWANDIKSADLIQPGDSLVILPITGVRHVVKSGDTLQKIAEKYDGQVADIMAYNGITDESAISVGDTVVIPGGEVPYTKVAPRAVAGSGGGGSSAGFSHPLPGSVKTQGLHGYNGVDFGAPTGTGVRAAAPGEVILVRNSGWNGGYGLYIVIKHDNGTQTLYAHNSRNYVVPGQRVNAGETIATVGSTGRSTGSHLHFEVRGARNPF